MKWRNSIAWLSPFIFILMISCGSVKEPDFIRVENIRFNRVGFKESGILLDLRYYNPNKPGLKFKKASGDAWMDDHFLGHFTIDTLMHLPGFSEFVLPVSLDVDMSHFIRNTALLLLAKEVTIKIDGTARVGKGLVYINLPIRYSGTQNLGELIR